MPDTPLERFRARFPIFEHSVYVNSCSQGALSLDVEAAMQAFVASWRTSGSPWDVWVDTLDRLRAMFARTIGADVDEVAVMPNASCAIGAVATALAFDTDRRTVVMGEFEFPTMAHVWLAQARRGARIDWVPARGDTLPIEHYAEHVDDHTLVVPAAHVCFRNGYRLDIAALTRLCHERGAYVMLDDYQSTGTAPIDVHALGVDVMVTGSLKYLLGPAGVAFLYVRRGLIERLEPLTTGWFGRDAPFAFDLAPLDWASTARRFETGSPAMPAVYGALAGLELVGTLAPAEINAAVGRLVARLVDGARAAGFDVTTPDAPIHRSALVVVRSSDAAVLAARLAERRIIASARGPGLRLSFHAYNNDADVDAVLDALGAEAALVARR